MKKGLLGSTALVGATALMAGTAGAAEAPTWKLTGNANFQFYWVDQDYSKVTKIDGGTKILGTDTKLNFDDVVVFDTGAGAQDHDWYFGVDEAELQLNVSGTADNGLNYGFKIEINANTTDGSVADEARLQLSGGWGTLQMGDEDGAEDIMNYGGENLMGATGGFDGDFDDVLYRAGTVTGAGYVGTKLNGSWDYLSGLTNIGAPSYPTIAGDTSDRTKVSYFSPRFSGFQVGASITPTPNNGDDFKEDGDWENHYGLGANYDNSFGGVRVRASAVYSAASSNDTDYEDIAAWSVGGIVGWGPFSVGANYTDNGDSGSNVDGDVVIETSYWNAAASFETGPMYFSVGYFSSTLETGLPQIGDSTFETLSLTADYTIAPGLSAYAEVDMITDDLMGGDPGGYLAWEDSSARNENSTTLFIAGMNVSF